MPYALRVALSLAALLLIAGPVRAQTTPDASVAQADSLWQQGQFEAALQELEALDEAAPKNAEALWRLARVKADLGEEAPEDEQERWYRDALEDATAAVELDSASADAHVARAIASGRVGLISGDEGEGAALARGEGERGPRHRPRPQQRPRLPHPGAVALRGRQPRLLRARRPQPRLRRPPRRLLRAGPAGPPARQRHRGPRHQPRRVGEDVPEAGRRSGGPRRLPTRPRPPERLSATPSKTPPPPSSSTRPAPTPTWRGPSPRGASG